MEDRELGAIRAKLNRRLGRDVPEPLWEWLREQGYVDAAVNFALEPEVAFEDFVYEVHRLLVGYDMGRKAERERVEALGPEHLVPPGRGPAADESVAVTLNAHERDRVAALSACLARRAAQRADVRAFRSDILDGALLGPEQARRFLTSPAARLLSPAQFQEHGISPRAHTAVFAPVIEPWPIPLLPESVRYHDGGMVDGVDQQGQPWALRSVFVDPPGTTVTVGTTGQESFELAVLSGDSNKAGLTQVTIWPDSLLHRLYKMALSLDSDYEWPYGSAAWFVVTGKSPDVQTLRGGGSIDWPSPQYSFGLFRLMGHIWMSPPTVLKAYRAVQRQMLGQANRRLRERALTLLRFVEAAASDEGELPLWRELVDRWNHAYPDWAYRTADGLPEVRTFARDYHRAYRAVVTPQYHSCML